LNLLVLTANSIRHFFLANSLSLLAEKALVISETAPSDMSNNFESKIIAEHFRKRFETERNFFSGQKFFNTNVLPILRGELKLKRTVEVIKQYKPDFTVVFGSSILSRNIIALHSPGTIINLHLGLSPYYRGTGTNFWPFYNEEPQYVGATIMHINEGVDTGHIISHVTPKVEKNDDVHSLGCKVIKRSVETLKAMLIHYRNGNDLPAIPQWDTADGKYYRAKDFNEDILKSYYNKLNNGLIEDFLKSAKKLPRLIKWK
jgi:phosphoribosylglycinamide formyltransferase 1